MIINRLVLVDFGLYGGENVFDLTPNKDNDRPVILVQGHNGAGKTTFLEAVRLALYGKHALGARVARADYENYLRDRIHSPSLEKRASVQLTFTRQDQGLAHIFEVTRSWAARGASVIETLELTRDGEPVSNIAAENWDHYLEDMIPSGISQLFFFDGEKIQDIANETPTINELDAIKTLLGLDLITQLKSDLAVYNARRNPASFDVDLDAIERDLSRIKSELILAEEDAAECRAIRQQIQSRITHAQKVFQNEGGAAATDRAALKQTLREVEKQIGLLRGDLKRIAESPMPFCLAPKLITRFRKEMTNKGVQSNRKVVEDFLRKFAEDKKTKASRRPSWTQSHFDTLQAFLSKGSGADDSLRLDAEPSWIMERLNRIDESARREAASLASEFDNARYRRTELKAQLKGFDATTANEALETLKEAEYSLGIADAKLSLKEREIASLRHQMATIKSELDKALAIKFDMQCAEHKIDLANRARAALAVYEERILEFRVEKLSSHFVECFNALLRKKRLFSKVRVDPETFNISLIDKNNVVVRKEALSAGERQLFAISMLWALGKTSGRELPMIIDTPLSRLDKVHRKTIMENYVPHASQQIILLCTDTELTEDLNLIIEPYVARRYDIGIQSGSHKTKMTQAITEAAHVH